MKLNIMEERSSIQVHYERSKTTEEAGVDYNFFFRLYRYYLTIFNYVEFEIPYIKLVDGLPIVTSYKVDIRVKPYNDIVLDLYDIESDKNFVGWQIA